jgi:hypothetical protein
MTTTAGDTGAHAATPPAPTGGAGSVVRSILLHGAGIIFVILLLPLCLVIGIPFAAWAIAAGLVLFNRIVQGAVAWGVRDSSLTVQLGSHGFSMIFRALLTTLTLFFVGASIGANGDSPVGLDRPDLARSALVIFVICFTLDAGIEAIRRAAQREQLVELDPAPATPRETTA